MLGRAATRCRQAVRLAHSSGIAISAKSAKPSPTKLAVVERYAARVFNAVEDAASDAQNPADKLRALCSVYRQALTDSDRICLCGMLGAESCGLPDKLAAAVAAFFEANIDWIAKSLPKDASRESGAYPGNAAGRDDRRGYVKIAQGFRRRGRGSAGSGGRLNTGNRRG